MEKRTITPDTKVRILRSTRPRSTAEWSAPEWYLTTRLGNVRAILGLRHEDAIRRVTSELAAGPVSMIYDNQGACYALQVKE